jgi:hypothetical protein
LPFCGWRICACYHLPLDTLRLFDRRQDAPSQAIHTHTYPSRVISRDQFKLPVATLPDAEQIAARDLPVSSATALRGRGLAKRRTTMKHLATASFFSQSLTQI